MQYQPSFISLIFKVPSKSVSLHGKKEFVNDDMQYFTILENFQSGEKQKQNIFLPETWKIYFRKVSFIIMREKSIPAAVSSVSCWELPLTRPFREKNKFETETKTEQHAKTNLFNYSWKQLRAIRTRPEGLSVSSCNAITLAPRNNTESLGSFESSLDEPEQVYQLSLTFPKAQKPFLGIQWRLPYSTQIGFAYQILKFFPAQNF